MGSLTVQERDRLKELILKQYELTPNYLKISKATNIAYSSVRKYASDMGLKNIRDSNIIWIDEENVQCSKCSKIVSYNSLRVIRPKGPNRAVLSYCNKCRTNQIVKNNKSSIDAYFKNRIRDFKSKSVKYGTDFDLTVDFLKNQYKKQQGKCFYTGVEMEIPVGGKELQQERHVISVDRVIPNLGYTQDNIVLCTKRANSIKGICSLEEIKDWLPRWYEKIADLKNF